MNYHTIAIVYRLHRAFQIACTTVILVLLLLAFMMWMDGRDKELNQAMSAYEDCVIREYNMTPIQWYEEQGKYPECGTRPK